MQHYEPAVMTKPAHSIIEEKHREADARRRSICALTGHQSKIVLTLGKELAAIKFDFDSLFNTQEWLEGVYGYPTFKSLLSAPQGETHKGLDIPSSSADTYMRLYRVFVKELKLDIDSEELKDIHYSKLDTISPYVNSENLSELLNKCRHLSRSDLRLEMESLKTETENGADTQETETAAKDLLSRVQKMGGYSSKKVLEVVVLNLQDRLKTGDPIKPRELIKLIEKTIELL